MTRREKVLAGLALALLSLSGGCFVILPGVRFSACLLGALAAACLAAILLGRWGKKNPQGRICLLALRVMLAAGAVVFLAAEGVLLFRGEQDHTARPADAVLVLGAGVNGETPSLILQTRIDAAASYLLAHPETPAVLSGGKGPGEDITEAEAMRRALIQQGIDEKRLWLESDSTSTAENFRFSKAVLAEKGIALQKSVIAVVTSDFHCYRAALLGRRAGLTVFTLGAEVPWQFLSANYYIREAFALVKTLIFD